MLIFASFWPGTGPRHGWKGLSAVIEIQDLSKVYESNGRQVVALDHVNLTIPRGQIFGIIGLSGAGKSTLVRCINLLERPTSGRVLVDGQDFSSLRPSELRQARRQVGMIFQHFNLLSSRTVYGNVMFPLEIAGVDRGAADRRVRELLELVGLADKAQAYPGELSGGQKQRVGIARALANEPKVLLSDEATSALDPQTTKSILALLQEINQRLGITMVVITHEMAVIKEICDMVAVIEEGRIVETGPTIDIFAQPKTATARRFVASVISDEIPPAVLARRQGPVVRVTFVGEVAREPIISQLVQQFGIKANILYGHIDHVKGNILGSLALELRGEPETIGQALRFLESQRLHVEELDNSHV